MTKNGDYIDLNSFNDKRGTLISMEQGSEIPFEIKRVYFLTNLKLIGFKPIKSSNTKICPSQLLDAPIPIVGTFTILVTCFANDV